MSINTPGAFSQITSSSGSTLSAAELKIKAASTDRALRYDVLNKILANPLKSDEESGWYTSRADLQNDLSSRNPAKYNSINLSNYTLGDVFGNIINEEGIEELLRSGADQLILILDLLMEAIMQCISLTVLIQQKH